MTDRDPDDGPRGERAPDGPMTPSVPPESPAPVLPGTAAEQGPPALDAAPATAPAPTPAPAPAPTPAPSPARPPARGGLPGDRKSVV